MTRTRGRGGACSARSCGTGQAGRRVAPAGGPRAAASAGAGAVRPAGAALDRGAGPRPVPRRGGPGAVRGDRRALDAAARRDRSRPRSGWCWACTPTRSAGRWSAAARRRVADALAAELRALGGEIVPDHRVDVARGLAVGARAVIFDTTPTALAAIAGDRLPERTRPRLRGASATARASSRWTGRSMGRSRGPPTGSARAATVHLGGIARRDRRRRRRTSRPGRHAERPFTLFVQYHPWDPTRAPEGKTTAWAYCHVPPTARTWT